MESLKKLCNISKKKENRKTRYQQILTDKSKLYITYNIATLLILEKESARVCFLNKINFQ